MRGHCSVVSGLPCSAADHWFPGCSPATGGKQGTGQSTLNIEDCSPYWTQGALATINVILPSIIYGGRLSIIQQYVEKGGHYSVDNGVSILCSVLLCGVCIRCQCQRIWREALWLFAVPKSRTRTTKTDDLDLFDI